jgi:hypothetical protein
VTPLKIVVPFNPTDPVTPDPSMNTYTLLVPPDPPAEEFVQLNGDPPTEIDTGAKSRRLLETNPFVAVRAPDTVTPLELIVIWVVAVGTLN